MCWSSPGVYPGIEQMKYILIIVIVGVSFILAACGKSGAEGIERILSASSPPEGVVFEISSDDDKGLTWAVPLVRSYINQLREKFPAIKLAIVFHGEEQYQLTKESSQYFPEAHNQVKRLVNEQGVDVHVCGNYAVSSGFNEDDFVDFIDVATRGPAMVNDYENAGYVVIFIGKPVADKTG